MIFQPCDWFGVLQFCIAKHFTADGCQTWIIFQQFRPRIDMIVIVIVLAIVVEPRLNPFGEVFVVVD